MPQTIKHKRSAHKIRRRADTGVNKTRPRRKRVSRPAKSNSGIVANSLFALTVKPIPGIAWAGKIKRTASSRFNDVDDYEQMYRDLLASVQNACRLKGVVTTTDPYAGGMDLSSSLLFVINLFEHEILPGKPHGEYQWNYNIDKDDTGYFFTMYRYCEMQQFWHAFEIKHIVKHLRRKNKKLHILFIRVLKTFMVHTDISAWYNGALGYADYWFDEEIEFWWDNHDQEDEDDRDAYDEALITKDLYEKGEAKRYQRLLEKSPANPPEKLIVELSKFSKKNLLVKWMIEACIFIQQKHCWMNGFMYEEDENQEGLKFDQQVGVIWDWDDEYTHAQSEAMDSDANNIGVLSPCFYYHITPTTQRFDVNELMAALEIPSQVTTLFDHYYDAVNPIRNAKRKN
jgi:hypothetical protein